MARAFSSYRLHGGPQRVGSEFTNSVKTAAAEGSGICSAWSYEIESSFGGARPTTNYRNPLKRSMVGPRYLSLDDSWTFLSWS